MKQYLADKIRNIALVGHGSCGKTSLAEALLFRAGAADRLGKVENGTTVCDYDPEEIKRVASVSLSLAPLEWNNTKINIIDTPGAFDFATGLMEGTRAAGSVIIVVSARSGVTVGTEKAYKLACEQNKSIMFFINKMDADHADFYKVLGQLREKFGSHVCPIVVPYSEGAGVECYIDLVANKAFVHDNGSRRQGSMPNVGGFVEECRNIISEAVAETEEDLMEKFFGGGTFTTEEMVRGINEGLRTRQIFPVLCGSSLTLDGIDALLDAIVNHLPSAKNAANEVGVTAEGEEVEVSCDVLEPLTAYVFKTIADPFIGKLSYVKVISGKLSGEITPINSRTGNPERLGKLLYITGKKQEDVSAVPAGDICAVAKLGETLTGDTLCDPKRVLTLREVGYPMATLTMAVVAKKKGEEGKIAQGLARLIEEDPVVTFVQDPETKQQLISGLGDQHLDVIVSRLKSKFGTEVTLEKPRVAYRETIRKKVKVQGRHKKQSGGHGQFGDVWIEFEPCDSDGLEFCENVFGGSVPKNFFPAVEKGLQDAIKHGMLAGYPMVGLKATLVDGSYHPVDSSEMAFKTAASLAYKAGIPQASPVILEPIGSLKVYVPDSYTGDIIGDLNKRRGRILGMNPWGDGTQEIVAEVPISEMYDFTTTLRSMTQGRGSFVLTFERYEQLPGQLEASVIAEAKALADEE
ncbi:elongation factor G [Yanshouia hominis]|uniref:Elongation factor G n=1 Tax=Yanshouia hominis TaxID=2763673 RepID=A0ABR7NL52_9FIRM|nr:elongation factor G [Yanshouia hominis]MBC8577095.1 elongation factor G [Yanshouia hominis]